MWIVRIALKRPYTFVVLAMLILFVGPLAILRTPTDIFPNIDIPVVTVVWNYGGLSADEMATRIVTTFERGLTTTVNDIEHIESQSLRGIAVIKIFFQPGAQDRGGDRAGHRDLADVAAADAAGHQAAAHHQLQRLERADPAARRCRARACPSSSSSTSASTSSARSSRRCRARRSRCRTAASSRRSRSTSTRRAAGQGPVADRRGQRDQRAEPDPARPARRRSAASSTTSGMNGSPRHRRRAERPADQDGQRRADLHPRRRARARRLPAADQHRPRRRPARGAADDPEDGNASTLDIIDARQGGAAADRRRRCRRSSRSSRSPTSRCSSAPRSRAWSARRSSPRA